MKEKVFDLTNLPILHGLPSMDEAEKPAHEKPPLSPLPVRMRYDLRFLRDSEQSIADIRTKEVCPHMLTGFAWRVQRNNCFLLYWN